MTLTKARKLMRDENLYNNGNIKYINTYKIAKVVDDYELVLYSEKTGKKCIVCDREDIGGFTGATLRPSTCGR